MVNPIPEGYYTLTPYLIVKNAGSAIEFYKKAFNATELMRIPGPEGKVAHAEIKIGNSPFMIADEFPEMGSKGPEAFGGSPISLVLYVEDADALFHQAIQAGATEMRPLRDQFYGDRAGTLKDPFGHTWTISTHKEDLTSEEIAKRAASH